MFKSLRRQLTISFVWLSAAVYLSLAIVSILIFYETLTVALDHELRALSAQVAHQINLNGKVPVLVHWENIVQAAPFTYLGTVQIFDAKGDLLEQHGSRHKVSLLKGAPEEDVGGRDSEVTAGGEHLRVLTSPLISNHQIVGYLQILHPTSYREEAIQDFAITMALVAPLLLLGLGITGYVFAGKALLPIEQNYLLLRQFMTDAGHELSTPLSIIQANSESMEQELHETASSSQTVLNRLLVIERTTKRMGDLVQDLSLLAKTESAFRQIPKEIVQLNQVTLQTKEEFIELFKEKHITFIADTIDPVQVLGDAGSIKRAITNLLQNALRYTDAGGSVTMSLKNQGKSALLTVQDTGIGIPKENRVHVFERFYRVDKSRSRAQGGSGLGLSIVKAIAEAHEGSVSVESEEGKGSEFAIALPSLPPS